MKQFKTTEKIEVTCPLCGIALNKWKLINIIWKWNPEKGYHVPHELPSQGFAKFEKTSIQEHVQNNQCVSSVYSNKEVLNFYFTNSQNTQIT